MIMIEICPECQTEILYTGDPQYVYCPNTKCNAMVFRYTWEMCMSVEERATEELLTSVEIWFPEQRWKSSLYECVYMNQYLCNGSCGHGEIWVSDKDKKKLGEIHAKE